MCFTRVSLVNPYNITHSLQTNGGVYVLIEPLEHPNLTLVTLFRL